MPDRWLPKWFQISPLFQPLELAGHYFQSFANWPSLNDLNQWNKQHGLVKFVPQPIQNHNKHITNKYEATIYLKQQVHTRAKNWHDFFNAIIWKTFPKIKQQINRHQYLSLSYRRKNKIQQRLPIENFLTHFDECGMLILSTNVKWFDLINNHAWEDIFWQQRITLQQAVRFIVFGHSIYEKAISPYIGLTAKAIFLNLPIDTTLEQLDCALSDLMTDSNGYIYKQKLQPIPLLGIPGWHPNAQQQNFYANKKYFRAKS